MKINVANVSRNINQIERLNQGIAGNNIAAESPLTGSFSSVTGIDHVGAIHERVLSCLLYTSPSPRDLSTSRMPSSA